DATSAARSLLDSVPRDVSDAAADDLVERNESIEGSSGEDPGFGDDIVAFDIVRRVRFGVASCLCIGQRSGILEPLSHTREDMIRGAIENPAYGCDARSSQTFSD